jgi:hypothetical protein
MNGKNGRIDMKIDKFKKQIKRIGIPFKLIEERYDSDHRYSIIGLEEFIQQQKTSADAINHLCSWKATPEGHNWWDQRDEALQALYNTTTLRRTRILKTVGDALGYDTSSISKEGYYDFYKISKNEIRVGCTVFSKPFLVKCFNILLDDLGYELK